MEEKVLKTHSKDDSAPEQLVGHVASAKESATDLTHVIHAYVTSTNANIQHPQSEHRLCWKESYRRRRRNRRLLAGRHLVSSSCRSTP